MYSSQKPCVLLEAQWLFHMYTGRKCCIFLVFTTDTKKKTTDTSNSMDEFKKHHANWKKPDLNGLWFHLNRVREKTVKL